MTEDSPSQGIIFLVQPYSYIDTSFRGPKPMSRSLTALYPFLTSHELPTFLASIKRAGQSLSPLFEIHECV